MYVLEQGTPYRHYKGDVYIIHCTSTDEETGVLLVTYVSLKDGRKWTRKQSVFCEDVTVCFGDEPIITETGELNIDLTHADKTVYATATYLVPRFQQISDDELAEEWRELCR